MVRLNSSQIVGVGHYVPEKIWTNHDLAEMMDTSDTWIRERTGIEQRHIAAINEGTSDLGLFATKKALEKASLEAKDLDLIIAGTLSPDFFFPGIGVLIQDKLDAGTIPAIDIRGQCSGFAWGLATADAFIKSGLYKNIAVVGAEIHSRIIEFSNTGRNVSVLFGDAGGAAIVQGKPCQEDELPSAKNQHRGMIDHVMGSDGSGAEHLAVLRPGCAAGQEIFMLPEEVSSKAYLPFMEGKLVFKNAVSRMIESINTLLERNNMTHNDIDLLIPHQANLRINEMVRQKLKLPKEKVFNNIHKYGNTTSATLPLCMSEAETAGILRRGDLVMTVAFGSGFTWGANLIRW